MNIIDLLGLSAAVSMHAFAVAGRMGLGARPLIGYFVGESGLKYIASIDHWLIFGLLAYIGVNMIREAKKDCDVDPSVGFKNMLMLSLATSIDALAAGLSLAFIQANVVFSVVFIGVTTFLISMAGVRIGNVFGAKYKAKAETAGGIILIALGLKFLIQHLV